MLILILNSLAVVATQTRREDEEDRVSIKTHKTKQPQGGPPSLYYSTVLQVSVLSSMNFFGGGQQEAQGPDPVFAAKTEMEMYTGKCVPPRRPSVAVLAYLFVLISIKLLHSFNNKTRSLQQDCRLLFR